MTTCPTNYRPYIDENGEPSHKNGTKAAGTMLDNSLDLIDHVTTTVYGDVVRMDGSRMPFQDQYTLIRNKMMGFMDQHQDKIIKIDNKIKEGKTLTKEESNSYIEVKSQAAGIAHLEAMYKGSIDNGELLSMNPLEAMEELNVVKARSKKALIERLKKDGVLSDAGEIHVIRDGRKIDPKTGKSEKIITKLEGVQLDGTRQIFKPLSRALEVISNRADLEANMDVVDTVDIELLSKFNEINLASSSDISSKTRAKAIELGIMANPFKKESLYTLTEQIAAFSKAGAVTTSFANALQNYVEHIPMLGYAAEKVAKRVGVEIEAINFFDQATSKESLTWYQQNRKAYGIVKDIEGLSGTLDSSGIIKLEGTGKVDKTINLVNGLSHGVPIRMLEHLRNSANKKALYVTDVWAKQNDIGVGSYQYIQFFEEVSAEIASATHLSHKALITAPSFGAKGIFHLDGWFNMADSLAHNLYKNKNSDNSQFGGTAVASFNDHVGRLFTGWFHEAWQKQITHGKMALKSGNPTLVFQSVGTLALQASLLGATSIAPVALVANLAGLVMNMIDDEQNIETVSQQFNSRLSLISAVYPELVSEMRMDKNNLSPASMLSSVMRNIASPVSVGAAMLRGEKTEKAIKEVGVIGMSFNKIKKLENLIKNIDDGLYYEDPLALAMDSMEAILAITPLKGTMDSIGRASAMAAGGISENKVTSDIFAGRVITPYSDYGDKWGERASAAVLTMFGGRTQYEMDLIDDYRMRSDDVVEKVLDRVNKGQLQSPY